MLYKDCGTAKRLHYYHSNCQSHDGTVAEPCARSRRQILPRVVTATTTAAHGTGDSHYNTNVILQVFLGLAVLGQTLRHGQHATADRGAVVSPENKYIFSLVKNK